MVQMKDSKPKLKVWLTDAHAALDYGDGKAPVIVPLESAEIMVHVRRAIQEGYRIDIIGPEDEYICSPGLDDE